MMNPARIGIASTILTLAAHGSVGPFATYARDTKSPASSC
jgi:hypothetical protein